MRLARCLGVSVVATSVAFGGLIVATPIASAECRPKNGTMVCTDPDTVQSAPAKPPTTIGCDWDWWCDEFGMDFVIGKSGSNF